jgi:valyl-tRNA synthetase
MAFSGFEFMGERPFKTVLFTGLVRDAQGRKMSKSLGNGIDPLEVIDQYGADALRFALVIGNSAGSDMRLSLDRVETYRNFANKVWNASRFIFMNLERLSAEGVDLINHGYGDGYFCAADCFILSKLLTVTEEITDALERYDAGLAATKLYEFIWDDFCDWYIEMAKPRLFNATDDEKAATVCALKTTLLTALKLLHPFMPFITEEIYQTLRTYLPGSPDSIMIADWPKTGDAAEYSVDEALVDAAEHVREAVKVIRAVRYEKQVPQAKKITVHIVTDEEYVAHWFRKNAYLVKTLAGVETLDVFTSQGETHGADTSAVIDKAVLYFPLSDMVDVAAERIRLHSEAQRLTAEVERGEALLANAGFVSKAPASKIAAEQEKLAKYKEMLAKVQEQAERMT